MARFTSGWVKVYRSIDDGDLANSPNARFIFIQLLLWANVEDSSARVGDRRVPVPRGSVLCSLSELAAKVGCSRPTVKKHLDYLEKRGTIAVSAYKTGTVVRIVNFEAYQAKPEEGDSQDLQGANKGLTRGLQGVAHNEEYKNIRRDSLPRARAREEALGLVQSWNLAFAQELIIPQVRVDSLTPTSARMRSITAALKRHPELGFWTTEVFPRILASDFLTGKIAGKSGEPFKCSFDWVLKEANLTKILEGNYANKRTLKVEPAKTAEQFKAEQEAWLDRHYPVVVLPDEQGAS